MGADVPVEGKTVRTMAFNMLKRTHYLFSNGVINSEDEDAILRERYIHSYCFDVLTMIAIHAHASLRNPMFCITSTSKRHPGV